jgi:phage FluMu gp28-like protein
MVSAGASVTDLDVRALLGIQYGRDDVDYHTWYGDWPRQLARDLTRPAIERELGIASAAVSDASRRHLRAVQASTSMASQSSRRAHARNVVAATGERRSALRGALEIHYLFPEHAKQSDVESAP